MEHQFIHITATPEEHASATQEDITNSINDGIRFVRQEMEKQWVLNQIGILDKNTTYFRSEAETIRKEKNVELLAILVLCVYENEDLWNQKDFANSGHIEGGESLDDEYDDFDDEEGMDIRNMSTSVKIH